MSYKSLKAPVNIHCRNQRKKHKTGQEKTSAKVLEISKETHHSLKYKQENQQKSNLKRRIT